MPSPVQPPRPTESEDRPPDLLGIDHVELWVGNARQAVYFYEHALGFQPIAYAGPETGSFDQVSYALAQGDIRFVVTSGLTSNHPVARHVRTHGDGVHRIAFRVDDAVRAHRRAVERGAVARGDVQRMRDADGVVEYGCIRAWGDAEYAFVSRARHDGVWMPGFVPLDRPSRPTGLSHVDHVVANVPKGNLADWVEWHGRVLDLQPMAEFSRDVSTSRSGLSSVALANRVGTVTMPINEPADGPRTSQIQEFLDAWGGAGVQHVAIATDDIVETVAAMQARGVDFLSVEPGYYERIRDRMGDLPESVERLEELGILVDRDDRGHLLQIFTEPVQDRPTLFFEVIQRLGSTGFGAGNFGALFTSLELAQERRGNL